MKVEFEKGDDPMARGVLSCSSSSLEKVEDSTVPAIRQAEAVRSTNPTSLCPPHITHEDRHLDPFGP